MANNAGTITYACGHEETVKLGGCARWRHEAFEARSEQEGRHLCSLCQGDLRNATSLADLRSLAFRMAWETARRAADRFDAPVRSFFALALKQAYAFLRSRLDSKRPVQVLAIVIRKTAKAVLARHEDGTEAWWPKSQIRLADDRLTAPAWLVAEKLAA